MPEHSLDSTVPIFMADFPHAGTPRVLEFTGDPVAAADRDTAPTMAQSNEFYPKRYLPVAGSAPRFLIGLGFVLCMVWSAAGISASSWPGDSVTVKLRSGQKTTTGRLIEFNNFRALVLRRDGRMVEFRRQEIDEIKRVSGFTPYSSLKLQDHYRKVFGEQYEVTRTRHYVVVHPQGMRAHWADPLDELYNRFQYYFSVRGFTLRAPEFPMVVVVFNSRAEFNRVAGKDGVSSPNSYAGYYSPESNWVVTYRQATQHEQNWESNETLIHEALHQYAFNHGIHQRWAATPQWCAEGLAALFEARGVHHARQYRSPTDKLNPVYLRLLEQAVSEERIRGTLRQLVASDQVFQEDIALAYSLSWGLVFYLAETHPSQFNDYLQRIAQRERSAPYTSNDRLTEFAKAFGADFALLESHFQQFIEQLR